MPFVVETGKQRDLPDRKMEKVYVQISWKPMEKIYLKQFKEAMLAYEMQPSYIRQILNNCATQSKIIPNIGKNNTT